MSEPIVPLWLAECCDDAILPHLIGYTSSASIPQHSQRSRDRKPPDSDLDAICHHRKGASASKRLEEQWAKSGTLMTISEYRMVHDQTTCSNGRYWEVFHSRL
jgi:hypothetical protein